MSSSYSNYSPYYKTSQTWYLYIWTPVTISQADDDSYFTITSTYNLKPWVLAKELYDNEKLYWVFAVLNKNILVDPVYDFTTGTTIRVPSNDRLQKIIGA